MKNFKIYILSIALLSLASACSTNQDLVQLDEYDDLYYTPKPERSLAEVSSASQFEGANSAESSYYGESPFVNESEKPSSEFEEKSNEEEVEEEDYYDPNYASRIENFHRSDDPHYVYSDAFANNMNPQFYGSFNSFNGFNNFGFGMSIGSPWMGNRWCDPYWDPFCRFNSPWGRPGFGMTMGWGATWGMYDPFSPWYNPYAYRPYGFGWGNPYAFNPYGYNPYYGPGFIVIDGSGGNSRGYQNTPRGSSGRNSRGGIVGSGSSSRGGIYQGDDGPKSNNTNSTRGSASDVRNTRSRPVRSEGATDYYNRTDSENFSERNKGDAVTRSRARTNESRSTNNRQSATSPYTRQRERQSGSGIPDYSRYNRSNSRNYSTPTRSRSGGSNSYSTPSRSRTTTTPSRTPSTRSGSMSPRTSSPSRSSGGGGRRR